MGRRQILDRIPWDEVLPALDEMADAGWSRDESIEALAQLIDRLLVLDVLVPGPGGAALESIDGPVIRAVLGLAWRLAADPEARAARKARRAARRASREG